MMAAKTDPDATTNGFADVTPTASATATALRLIPEGTWGDENARIFSFEPLEVGAPLPAIPDGPTGSRKRR